jgi:hypothetical protein
MQQIIYISPVFGQFPPFPLGFIRTNFSLENVMVVEALFLWWQKLALIETLHYGTWELTLSVPTCCVLKNTTPTQSQTSFLSHLTLSTPGTCRIPNCTHSHYKNLPHTPKVRHHPYTSHVQMCKVLSNLSHMLATIPLMSQIRQNNWCHCLVNGNNHC